MKQLQLLNWGKQNERALGWSNSWNCERTNLQLLSAEIYVSRGNSCARVVLAKICRIHWLLSLPHLQNASESLDNLLLGLVWRFIHDIYCGFHVCSYWKYKDITCQHLSQQNNCGTNCWWRVRYFLTDMSRQTHSSHKCTPRALVTGGSQVPKKFLWWKCHVLVRKWLVCAK